MTEKPAFRKGQTVWRQRHGKIEKGRIYEVARITFRSQGYDEDPNGKYFMYRARFNEDRGGGLSMTDLDEQSCDDGDIWTNSFDSDKKAAYRKLASAAHDETLRLINELKKWADIESAARLERDYRPDAR